MRERNLVSATCSWGISPPSPSLSVFCSLFPVLWCQDVDVGGAWCWTSTHREVPALARRFGIAPFPQHDEGLHVIDYGSDKPVTRHVQSALV